MGRTDLKKIVIYSLLVCCITGCGWRRPSGLGVHSGELKQCPATPRCVSSQSLKSGEYIAPLMYEGKTMDVHDALLEAVNAVPRSKVIVDEPLYVYAEFKTKVMRFVDDFEAWIDENAKTVHFRSSSRIGYYDFHVNRNRVEMIKEKIGNSDKI